MLVEADLLDADATDKVESDPMWRKRVSQQSRRRSRGRSNS